MKLAQLFIYFHCGLQNSQHLTMGGGIIDPLSKNVKTNSLKAILLSEVPPNFQEGVSNCLTLDSKTGGVFHAHQLAPLVSQKLLRNRTLTIISIFSLEAVMPMISGLLK